MVVAAVETGLSVASAARDAGYVGPILLVSCDPVLPTSRQAAGTLRWLRESCVDLVLGACTERVDARRRVIVVRGHGEVAYGRLVVDAASLGPDADVLHLNQATGVEVLPGSSVGTRRRASERLLATALHSPPAVVNLAPDLIGAVLAVTAVALGLITRSQVSPV